MTIRPARLHRSRRPTGIALITAVIMLLVITLLALGGARLALDTKRSTRNQRDFEIAYQAAEAALYDAEIDIQGAVAAKSRSSIFAPDKPV
jgi:type IV pilus assembly protein PilX